MLKVKSFVFGSDGLLRPIWRAAIYFALGSWVLLPLMERVYEASAKALHVPPGLNAAETALSEIVFRFRSCV